MGFSLQLSSRTCSSQGQGWCPCAGGGLGLCLCLVFPSGQRTISLLSVGAFSPARRGLKQPFPPVGAVLGCSAAADGACSTTTAPRSDCSRRFVLLLLEFLADLQASLQQVRLHKAVSVRLSGGRNKWCGGEVTAFSPKAPEQEASCSRGSASLLFISLFAQIWICK